MNNEEKTICLTEEEYLADCERWKLIGKAELIRELFYDKPKG
jgi:hypothetical protein